MPDISMCANETCPKKDTCYRYTATPSYHQAYGGYTVPPGYPKCDAYWKV